MSEETVLSFSVAGLTVRGLDFNVDKWVPKKGERLSCSRSSSGCIEVFKDGQRVGLVAKEAPNTCKEWLKCNGEMEAVVISVPKKHRNKGREVPVVFVFKSVKSCLMENTKRGIKSGIDSLQKKKKSVKFEEGDSTENMVFSDDENDFDFQIHGMFLRGFGLYKNYWVPEIDERRKCSLSASKSVEIMKDGTTVGNVEKDGQELFRKFINAGGDIYAVVVRGPKANKSKGEEIPVIYEFSAQEWTNRLKNVRIEIKDEILKRSKKKKSLKFICSTYNPDSLPGTSSATQEMTDTNGHGECSKMPDIKPGTSSATQEVTDTNAHGEGGKMPEKKPGTSSATQEMTDTNGHGECSKMPDIKVKGSHKRRSDELPKGSPNEKVARRESSLDDTNSDQKSAESDFLPETKSEALLQAPSSPGTSSATQEMTNTNGHGEGSKIPDKKVHKESKRNSRLPEANKNTPKKSASSSKASKKSASVSKTPKNSGNKITKYFTPKSSQSVESVVDNDKEINLARKKILQKEDEKGDNNEENKKDLTAGNRNLSEEKPLGSFFDVNGHVETVLLSEAKVAAARSVCKIFSPTKDGTLTATGFRVGSRFIMTACHVTRSFLEGHQYAAEKYVVFNYKHESGFHEEDRFYLGKTVFSNLETDISVVELECDSRTLPPSLHLFCSPVCDRGFHLIGHSQGNIMETNFVDKICIDNLEKARLRNEMYEKSINYTGGRHCDCPPHDTIDNPHRFLFRCRFTKGGSGAPGVVLIGINIYVTTVLLWGYPNWYFDKTFEEKKVNWPEGDCIQQGVNLKSLQEIMHLAYPELSVDIFGDQPIS